MKNLAKIFSFLLVISIFFSLFSIVPASAATTSTISFSKNQLTVGDQFTVTVRVNADENMYAVGYCINYDASVLEFVSGDNCNTTAAGVLKVAFASSSKSSTATYTFKAIGVGNTRIATADASYENLEEKSVAIPLQGGTVNVKAKATTSSTTSNTTSNSSSKPTVSNDATLKSLSVDEGSLSPKFSASKTSYSVAVPNSVTKITIFATANHKDAKVKIKGDTSLKIGKNQLTVEVTAPDGTVKNYTVNVLRSETEEVSSIPESSNEETTSSVPENTDLLNPVIDGVKYEVATDLSDIPLLNGFRGTKTKIDGQEVGVAVDADKTFKIFYLKAEDSSDWIPYSYNAKEKTFEKLIYLIQKETVYFICNLPDDYTVPEEYYSTNTIIAKTEVKCFSNINSEMNDFYYLYCFANGRYGFYRYDSREVVLQRYPELKLVKITDIDTDVEPLPDHTFLGRFKALTTNAKIVVLGFGVIIVLAAVLAVLMLIKFTGKREYDDFEDDAVFDDFDSVSVMSNFSISNNVASDNDEVNKDSADDENE